MNFSQFDNIAGYSQVDSVELQRGFINRVFGWMTVGLGLTGFTAFYCANRFGAVAINNPALFYGVIIGEIVLVFALSFATHKLPPFIATLGFLLYAILNGIALSWIFLAFSMNSIASTFFATSLTFGAMGLFGWVTKKDLTSLGNLCFMFLIGIIIASLVNLFMKSSMFDTMISILGILIFVGLTAYDTQKIKNLAISVGDGNVSHENSKRFAVLGALELYLDFINLFLYLLRFLGNRK